MRSIVSLGLRNRNTLFLIQPPANPESLNN